MSKGKQVFLIKRRKKIKLRFKKYPSKKPRIVTTNILTDRSPLPSPTKIEKNLSITHNDFKKFEQDLDELSQNVDKLIKEAPECLKRIEEIKKKQDNVEDCIAAANEKLLESRHYWEKSQILQHQANEDINNDLKEIQQQLNELLDNNRTLHSKIESLDDSQTHLTEELDTMLHAIDEYARLIEECSSTIKHFDEINTPIEYESLDLSLFRGLEGRNSNFKGHIYRTTPDTSLPTSRSASPNFLSKSRILSPIDTKSTGYSESSSCSLSPVDSPVQTQQLRNQTPYNPLRHQHLLLMEMHRAAVGLKFLLYAKQLNELKKWHPELDLDLAVDLSIDPLNNASLTDHTYQKISTIYSGNIHCDSDSEKNRRNGENIHLNENISIRIRKRPRVVHSYDLPKVDKPDNTVKPEI
ncbi:hypothetical protein G9A89_013805 [Geosiphon pyriformis]|nr:hypothetical protein G9A89_013805 [Geosiphon pyriformis]